MYHLSSKEVYLWGGGSGIIMDLKHGFMQDKLFASHTFLVVTYICRC